MKQPEEKPATKMGRGRKTKAKVAEPKQEEVEEARVEPEKEDEDAFSVTEFFKDMCTIWNCLATQSKTKDVKANQKAIEDKSEEPLKDPLPLLPAIEHSGDKIEETSGTLDTIEKEGGSQLEVENSESEDGSETSSGGEIVDYQSMIYLPEKQLKQIGKALAALHCWYCKVLHDVTWWYIEWY